MNALAKVSDDWTAEYKFADIEIEEDGLFFGSFSGVAELGINQPGEPEFYVKHITVSGRSRKPFSRLKQDACMHLTRRATHDSSFKAHLFRKIEATLYADPDVQEWFDKEQEAA